MSLVYLTACYMVKNKHTSLIHLFVLTIAVIQSTTDSITVKLTSPCLDLLQVYALGGFIILRWAWAKWQERKAKTKKDSSNEDQPPSDS